MNKPNIIPDGDVPFSWFAKEYVFGGYSAQFGTITNNIMFCLYCHMNSKTRWCFVSENTIAKEMGMSRTAVREHFKPLIEYKLIKRVKKPSKFGHRMFHTYIYIADKWRKLDSDLCTPDEQSNVHVVNIPCRPKVPTYVHDVDNNKNIGIRIDKIKSNVLTTDEQEVDAFNKQLDKQTGVNLALREKMKRLYINKNNK